MKNFYKLYTYAVMALLAGVSLFMPDAAYAGGTGLDLCPIVAWLTGDVAQAVATVAVIAIGIGAALGRMQWTTCIIVAIGVAVIFGSEDLIALAGNNASGCGGAV